MDELDDAEARQVFALLNPYQVAVLAFTTPEPVDRRPPSGCRIVLTSKDSYVWAAAVGHLFVHRPELEDKAVREMLNSTLSREGPKYAASIAQHRLGTYDHLASELALVQAFLQESGLGEDSLRSACELTDDAIRCLEWLEIARDPPFKTVLGAIVAVYALAGPVSFTATGKEAYRYSTATWEAERSKAPGSAETRFDFNLKVHRIANLIKEDVPALLGKFIDIAATPEPQPHLEAMELQQRLSQLGYYRGTVDGKIGSKTLQALKRFQQDRDLKVTSYPDAATIRVLRTSKMRPTN